jgi:hypothetical protein
VDYRGNQLPVVAESTADREGMGSNRKGVHPPPLGLDDHLIAIGDSLGLTVLALQVGWQELIRRQHSRQPLALCECVRVKHQAIRFSVTHFSFLALSVV